MAKTFYIAADYARRAEVAKLADELETELGMTSYTNWATAKAEYNDDASGESMAEDQRAGARRAAIQDNADVCASNFFIQLTTGQPARGGRHAELGIAVARKVAYPSEQAIIIVGPREHVFHEFPGVVQVSNAQTLKAYLRGFLDAAETA